MKRLLNKLRRKLRPINYTAQYLWHRLKPRVSYANDSEDLIAWMLLGGIARFIDVGANDGISGSNTALAALRGARGLCFEPNPADYALLAGFYRCATHIQCIQEGLSDTSGMVDLRCDGSLSAITATEDTGLTTLLAAFNRPDAPVITIPVERLSVWMDRHPEFQRCDLLSIDVEGHELSVLNGVDWERHPKPARCLVIETHADGGDRHWRHRDFDAIAALLALHGYSKLAASQNNTFWLHREDWLEARIAVTKTRFPHYTWFDCDNTIDS